VYSARTRQGCLERALENLDDAITMAAGAIPEGRNAVADLRSSTSIRNDLGETLRTLGDELATVAPRGFKSLWRVRRGSCTR